MSWVWDTKDERWVWETLNDDWLVAGTVEEQEHFDALANQGKPLLLTSEGLSIPCKPRKVGF
jgi:hypothetical protein